MKTAATQPAQPPTRKKTRRPGATWGGARPGAGAKKGRPRPAGAGLQALKPGENSKSLFVRLAESDRAKLEKIAAARGEKMSSIAREILLDFIAKNNT